ncbi:NADH-quinone oxidoreductase subunit C [Gammaproteobacteria bacterium]|nr:NADH-quinone oxidoreductase subunit C [Gammaproteobacteria bacterium]|tara:strand:- start:1307 stop:1918 length:612 start_codon:yes stop_codon:yes gene_type:complete
MPKEKTAYLNDEDIRKLLNANFKKSILDINNIHDFSVEIKPEITLDFIRFLKESRDLQYSILIDICGVDYPERSDRFDVVYHLLSMTKNKRIRVKVSIQENVSISSIVNIFPAAEWYEREAYDLYGINFSNHPDMRRMLTDYNFQGFPLRKDFPLTGYTQVRYDDTQKRVVQESVELGQEFRDFDFESPWLGHISDPSNDEIE